jgi:WD40 repeat protein
VLKNTLRGQAGRIEAVTFSPNGQHLASGTSSGIEIWDPATGLLKQSLLKSHAIQSIAYSPYSQFLACGARDGIIWILNPFTGLLEHTLEGHLPPTMKDGHPNFQGSIGSVAYSPDGQLLASGACDGTIKLWDPATGALKQTLEASSLGDAVFGVSFSPDGQLLASADQGARVKLCDPTIGALKCNLIDVGHRHPVAFSLNGKLLASGKNNVIEVWDVSTSQLISTLEGHLGWIPSVTFSPDGQLLAPGATDNTIRLWDSATGMVKHKHSQESHSSSVESIVFSPDGLLLASYSWDRTIKLWEIATGRVRYILEDLENYSEGVAEVAFSHDNQKLASGFFDGTVRLWDPGNGTLKHNLTGSFARPGMIHSVASLAFSCHGQLLAAGCDGYVIDIWDLATLTLKHTLMGELSIPKSLTFSPDGQVLASGTEDHISVWDLTTGALKHRMEDGMNVKSLAFLPGSHLLASDSTGRITLWDPETGAQMHTLSSDWNSDSDDDPSGAFSYLPTKLPTFIAQDWHEILLSDSLSPMKMPYLQDNRWVAIRGERKLWLPSDYTPMFSTVRDGALAFGYGNKRVHVITFDL